MGSFARYTAELRAGDVIHIESGVIDVDERGAHLAHRLYNSASGEVAAHFRLRLRYMNLDSRRGARLDPSQQEQLARYRVAWDGPEPSELGSPAGEDAFFPTVRDTIKPWEIDVLGHMSLEFYIHRFSDASTQCLSAMGMDPPYMRANRIGFSTFEFQASFTRELNAGDRVEVRSALMHVGSSSIRILSRLYEAETGELAAELSQYGVHLDLDARRPSRIPEVIRERGQAMAKRALGG